MNKHGRKMIAPVIITILFIAFAAVYVTVLLGSDEYTPWFLLPALLMAAMGAGIIYELITRIREIRKGEEDDLDNY